MFSTIVSGSDGRRGRGAASLAQVLADATGARLLLVGVGWEPPLPFAESHAHLREALERDLRGVRDQLAPDATIRFVYEHSPANALRRIAKEEHAELIVVGSHHRPATSTRARRTSSRAPSTSTPTTRSSTSASGPRAPRSTTGSRAAPGCRRAATSASATQPRRSRR